jgi:hypothetical protein
MVKTKNEILTLLSSMKSNVFSLLVLILLVHSFAWTQTSRKKERFPSYFGFQVRPVFPTRFIGEPEITLSKNEFTTTISQTLGYSFGGTVRAGITKLIAFETGINFTQRHFDITMALPDSNVFGQNDLTFISYDIPLNGLVYIQLSEQFYMNASLGLAVNFKPTDVGILTLTGGKNTFTHTGRVNRKTGFDLNANIGFEFRTEKSGFFYLGGSGRVPFAPLFTMVAQYQNQGYKNTLFGEVDGSFLALDFKYFFPIIQKKGPQWQRGPIQ